MELPDYINNMTSNEFYNSSAAMSDTVVITQPPHGMKPPPPQVEKDCGFGGYCDHHWFKDFLHLVILVLVCVLLVLFAKWLVSWCVCGRCGGVEDTTKTPREKQLSAKGRWSKGSNKKLQQQQVEPTETTTDQWAVATYEV